MSNNYFNFISRTRFDELGESYLNSMSPNRRTKAILTQEIVNQAIEILSGLDISANQKYNTGTANVQRDAYWQFYYSKKPMCDRENMYDVICSTHRDLQHAGYRKTFGELQHHYSYPPRKLFVNVYSINAIS